VSFRRAALCDDVWDGEMCAVRVEDRRVLLANVGGEVVALLDRCAHQGVALSEGRLEGGALVCRAHGWSYDARTGCGINPRSARLTRFPIRIEGGVILVDVAPTRAGEATSALAGPVLIAGPRADAVIAAIGESCPDVHVVERGSYVRVGVAGRCRVTREALMRHTGVAFALPADLEAIMPSFRGRFRVTDEEAEWVAEEEAP
jgi:toluene monooxygenase system ferredoxin subunit